jgi:hypothetical protein
MSTWTSHEILHCAVAGLPQNQGYIEDMNTLTAQAGHYGADALNLMMHLHQFYTLKSKT